MSNHHFKNRTLSFRAVGLLSVMLSVPENWDYTLAGLSTLHAESIDAVRTALLELENAGYVERQRVRNDKGQLKETEYIIRENPASKKPTLENPTLDNPIQAVPIQGKPIKADPMLAEPMQLRTYGLNTHKSNTYQSRTKETTPLSFWNEIKERLCSQLSSVSVQTWFDDCTPISFDGSVFTLQANTTFRRDVITKQYTTLLESIMAEMSGTDIKLIVTSAEPN